MLVLYVFIVFVIVTEVARRFLLSFSSPWGEEVARYAFIYLGWIGAAYAVRERAHIRFDVIMGIVPARLHGWFHIVADLALILFALIAMRWTMHSIETLIRFQAATPVLRIGKAWFEAAVPLGMALMIFRAAQNLWRDVADLRAGREAFSGRAMFD